MSPKCSASTLSRDERAVIRFGLPPRCGQIERSGTVIGSWAEVSRTPIRRGRSAPGKKSPHETAAPGVYPVTVRMGREDYKEGLRVR